MADRAAAVAAWEALFRAQVTVMRELTVDFPADTVSMTEYDVLFNLSRAPGRRLRMRDLNRSLLITQPSVSRLCDRLVARGLIAKTEDPADGRGTIVQLTASGFDLFRKVAVSHIASIDRVVGHALDDDELRQLTELAERLRLRVTDAAATHGPDIRSSSSEAVIRSER